MSCNHFLSSFQINKGLKYLAMFLPTAPCFSAEVTHDLWLDDLIKLWRTYSNSPAWEVYLTNLFSRLALERVGIH